jgi:hypothetical protein
MVIIFLPYSAAKICLIQRDVNDVEWFFRVKVNSFPMKSAKFEKSATSTTAGRIGA